MEPIESINQRVQFLIRTLGITKAKFSEPLHVTPQYISSICSGSRVPSERTLLDICRTYNVEESWLRTGVGEMFRSRSRKEEVVAFLGNIVGDGASDFQLRFIAMLAQMTPEQWNDLERLMSAILSFRKGGGNLA